MDAFNESYGCVIKEMGRNFFTYRPDGSKYITAANEAGISVVMWRNWQCRQKHSRMYIVNMDESDGHRENIFES